MFTKLLKAGFYVSLEASPDSSVRMVVAHKHNPPPSPALVAKAPTLEDAVFQINKQLPEHAKIELPSHEARCPECDYDFDVISDPYEEEQEHTCNNCGAKVKVEVRFSYLTTLEES